MRIYDYLFYKSFVLAKRSKNFDDVPVLGGIMFVIGCVIMNIFTIGLFLEGLGINTGLFGWQKVYKYLFVIGLVLLLTFYYSYKGRYRRIVERYESKADTRKQIHPVVVIVLYAVVSFGLLLIASLFKNRDWIFAGYN